MITYILKELIYDPKSEGNCRIAEVVRNEKGEIIEIIGEALTDAELTTLTRNNKY